MELSIPRSISGLVVEYIVAIDVTRVRFPADASYWRLYRTGCLPTMSKMVRNIPPQSKDFQKDNFTP